MNGAEFKLDPDAFPPKPAPAAFEAAIKAQLGVELEAVDPVAWAAKTPAQKTTDINTAFAALTTDAQKQTKFDDNNCKDGKWVDYLLPTDVTDFYIEMI